MVALRRHALALFTIVSFVLLPAGFAAGMHVVTVHYPDAAHTALFGINPSGDLAGSFIDSAKKEHGFVRRNGVFEPFDYPGATWTECYGINPQGDVVGQYGLPDFTTHGFLLPAGSSVAVTIDIAQETDLGLANTMPFKISPDGTIVGCLHQSDLNGNAFVYTMHGFAVTAEGTTTDPLAGSMHTGVNASGVFTGHYYVTNTTLDSYVIKNGDVTWFQCPGFAITRAYDVNTNGDVVGFCRKDTRSPIHGFLYEHGRIQLIDVNLPGVTATRAYGINPSGEIVGYYTAAGILHGFVLTRDE